MPELLKGFWGNFRWFGSLKGWIDLRKRVLGGCCEIDPQGEVLIFSDSVYRLRGDIRYDITLKRRKGNEFWAGRRGTNRERLVLRNRLGSFDRIRGCRALE